MLADECQQAGRSSCSSTTRSSTGIIPTTSRAGAPAATPAGPTAASGTATSTTWTPSSRSCSRATGPSAASGSTACGTGPTPTGGSQKTYDLIHRLQPAALVGSNHHLKPFPGEDFQMFEKDLPGHNTAGFNEESELGDLPFEMCETMNGAWGFNLHDTRYKSTQDLVQLPGEGGGLRRQPAPERRPHAQREDPARVRVTRLREMGAWLAEERRVHLRHARRAGPPAQLGRDDAQGRTRSTCTSSTGRTPALALPRGRRSRRCRAAPTSSRTARPCRSASRGRGEPRGSAAGRDPLDTVVVLEIAPAKWSRRRPADSGGGWRLLPGPALRRAARRAPPAASARGRASSRTSRRSPARRSASRWSPSPAAPS